MLFRSNVGITTPLQVTPAQRAVNPAEMGGVLATQMGGLSAAPTVFGGYSNVLAPSRGTTAFEQQSALQQSQQNAAEDSASPWTGILTGLLGTGASMAMSYATGVPIPSSTSKKGP